jgi:hypothetical protein
MEQERIKSDLQKSCAILRIQLENWLINQRKRHWAKVRGLDIICFHSTTVLRLPGSS